MSPVHWESTVHLFLFVSHLWNGTSLTWDKREKPLSNYFKWNQAYNILYVWKPSFEIVIQFQNDISYMLQLPTCWACSSPNNVERSQAVSWKMGTLQMESFFLPDFKAAWKWKPRNITLSFWDPLPGPKGMNRERGSSLDLHHRLPGCPGQVVQHLRLLCTVGQTLKNNLIWCRAALFYHVTSHYGTIRGPWIFYHGLGVAKCHWHAHILPGIIECPAQRSVEESRCGICEEVIKDLSLSAENGESNFGPPFQFGRGKRRPPSLEEDWKIIIIRV